MLKVLSYGDITNCLALILFEIKSNDNIPKFRVFPDLNADRNFNKSAGIEFIFSYIFIGPSFSPC